MLSSSLDKHAVIAYRKVRFKMGVLQFLVFLTRVNWHGDSWSPDLLRSLQSEHPSSTDTVPSPPAEHAASLKVETHTRLLGSKEQPLIGPGSWVRPFREGIQGI